MAIEYLGPLDAPKSNIPPFDISLNEGESPTSVAKSVVSGNRKVQKVEYVGPLEQPKPNVSSQPLLHEANSIVSKETLYKVADFFTGHFGNESPAPEVQRTDGTNLKINVPESGTPSFLQDPVVAASFGAAGGILKSTSLVGKIAAGAREAVGWLTGGASEVPTLAKAGVKGVAKAFEQKNLAERMTGLREAGLDVPAARISGKSAIIDAKAAIVDTVSTKLKEAEKMSQEQPHGGQQQPNPELEKQVEEIKKLKEVHESLGVVNAGEIPEGKVIELKPQKFVVDLQEQLKTQFSKDVSLSTVYNPDKTKSISIDRIRLNEDERLKGTGTNIVNEIKQYANSNNMAVEVHPNGDLVGFYEKQGFVKDREGTWIYKPGTMSTVSGGQRIKSAVAAESNQFTATNNIKEHQKELAAAKLEVATTTEAVAKEQPKGGRLNLIKERVETANAARRKEIEELSHYEETADPLTVDTQKTVQDALYKEPEGTAKPVTLQNIKELATKNELGVNANIGANGDMIISVTDKHGNKADFPLTSGGHTLQDVHSFVNGWTDDFGKSMQKQYEAKAVVIDNAPELAKLSGVTKKHTIPQTGEVIEYMTAGDLRMAYDQRGLKWKSDKKSYYKQKKLDEAAKAEIDDKLTPISQKSLPEIELLDTQGNGKKPGMLQWTEPFRFVAQDIELRTGFPIQQFESKIRDGSRQVSNSVVPYMKRLREARSGINRESSARIYKALENPSFRESEGNFNIFKRNVNQDKDLKGMLGDMTKTEYDSAGKIRKILGDAAEEYNIPLDKMVMDYAPRMMREGVSGWTEAVKKWQLPEEYNWAALEERSGYMRPHEENIFKVTDAYLRRGATKRYIGNHLEELSNQLNKTKFESKADIDQLNKYVATMRGWQTGFDESIRTSGETIARVLNKAINAPFKMVGGEGSARYRNISYKKMDVEQKMINPETGKLESATVPKYIKTGEEPGFFDIHTAANDFVNLHLKLSYAGALAWRPMVWARAMWQSSLSMPIVGPRWFAKGMSKVGSPEAWAEAKAATALFAESPVAGGELSRGWTIMDDITQIATWDTRSGHNVGRLVAYHAGKEKAAFYGGKFLENIKSGMKEDKAISKYLDDSGADFFHPVLIKNEIVPLLKAKDIESLSERMGLHTTAETQWLYEKGQAPYWARSTAGRVLGQFGVWPSWYIKYARNLATRGSKMNIAKRLAGFATMNALTYEVGKEVFGVDVSGWTVSHPFMWSPIPMQVWDSAKKLASGSDYQKEAAGNALMNNLALHIPGYLAVKSVMKGMEESRDEDKLKVMLGFKPMQEE